MAKKRVNKYKSQYDKQRKRVRNLINRYSKLGFEIDIQLPAIPKRITAASVRRLEKITPEKVRQKTYVPDIETGEVITFSEYKKKGGRIQDFRPINVSRETLEIPDVPTITVPSSAAPKVTEELYDFTDIVIEGFQDLINRYPDQTRDIMIGWFNDLLSKFERSEVAEMLEDARNHDMFMEPEEAYRADMVYSNISKMMNFLDVSAAEKNTVLNEMFMESGFNEEFYD